MRTTSKPPGLRIVAGTAYAPAGTENGLPDNPFFQRPEPPRNSGDPPLTETAKNGRLREKRKQAWREAEAATRYWQGLIDFDHAVSIAQMRGIPEGRYHPDVNSDDHVPMVRRYREALVRQLLTPAPDLMSVKWKQAALAGGQHRYADVKPERIEHAIAEDLAFLAAHPVRQSNRRSAKPKDDGGAA
jgi:hypothetical protein